MGNLLALDVATGRILWQKDYVKDFNASVPTWGMTGAPLVDGDRLICLVGGEPDAKVDRAQQASPAQKIWRSLSSDSEPGYNQPIIIEAGGARQLIIFHADGVQRRSIRRPARCTGRSLHRVADGDRRFDAGAERPTICSSRRNGAARACSGWTTRSRRATLLWSGPGEQDLGMTHERRTRSTR